MSYSEGWLINAIKYLENSVFIYRNGQNISLPIENSQRLDRLGRFVSAYSNVAVNGMDVLFSPYIDENGNVIKNTSESIKKIQDIKNNNTDESGYGNLIQPIKNGDKDIIFKSRNIYEALNSLAEKITFSDYKYEVNNDINIFEGFSLTPNDE